MARRRALETRAHSDAAQQKKFASVGSAEHASTQIRREIREQLKITAKNWLVRFYSLLNDKQASQAKKLLEKAVVKEASKKKVSVSWGQGHGKPWPGEERAQAAHLGDGTGKIHA